eukprot:GDKI01038746.1.p1 GENE.GDKI01038746.1~~GDKI01038746.1.p1  ORF type:complete len:256 (-),score=71.99 GDKI01038746.1:25-792(-)
MGYAFVCENGSVVLWGLMDKTEETRVLSFIDGFAVRPKTLRGGLALNLGFGGSEPQTSGGLSVSEVLTYCHIPTLPEEYRVAVPESRVHRNTVFLRSYGEDEKLAVSFAIAQSVKLQWHEEHFLKSVERIQVVPQMMAMNGKIPWRNHEISASIASVLSKIMDINAVSDIRDVPDYFWKKERWYRLYNRVHQYQEIEQRIELLNQRYFTIKELFTVVSNDREQSQAFRATWIIIVLLIMHATCIIIREVIEHKSL